MAGTENIVSLEYKRCDVIIAGSNHHAR